MKTSISPRPHGSSWLRFAALAGSLAFAPFARADLSFDWTASVGLGTSLSASLQGFVVDPSGVSFVTATSGSGLDTDIEAAAFEADGTLRWSFTYDGPEQGFDQARGLGLGADGRLYVAGLTEGPTSFANLLVLELDPATGALLDEIEIQNNSSESAVDVVADAAGNVYVAGNTTGDGGDVQVVAFDPSGALRWRTIWDGPTFAPFSQDSAREIAFDPSGDLVVLVHGIWTSQLPDYVVLKLDPADGSFHWVANWGGNGTESAADMEVDAAGDVYVTGTGIDLTDKYSTIKLDGTDGSLIWQFYDSAALDDSAFALALDGNGGVYVTGAVDPDGNLSNFNDDIYTVKRLASTGALVWTHRYGASCVGCLDRPTDVIVDSFGNAFVVGTTSSRPYSGQVILFALDAATGVENDRGVLSAFGTGPLALDADQALYLGGQRTDPNTGFVELTVTRFPELGDGPSVYCTAKASSAGCVAAIATSAPGAQPVSGAGGYSVTATDVQGLKNGLLFAGVNGAAALPFNGGTLCMNGPLKRGPIFGSGGTGPDDCTGSYSTEINDGMIVPFGLDAGSGNSGWYQYWYRDPNNGAGNFGTALSNAVQLDFQ